MWRRGLVALGIGLFTGIGAQAQTLSVDAFGVRVSYAPPPWATAETALSGHQQQGNSGPNTQALIIEYVPDGQTLTDWTELFAVFIETPAIGTATDQMDIAHQLAMDACASTFLQSSQTTPDDIELFIIYCPSYRNDPQRGEVMVMHLRLVGNTVVRNYYHRRYPAYTMETLPFRAEDLGPALDAVSAMRVN